MKIVDLDSWPLDNGDINWAPIRALGELELYTHTSAAEFASRVRGATVVLTNKVPIRKAQIDSLSECRLLGVLATGADILDLDNLAACGFAVVNVPAYGVEDVAQHALALLMELARHTALHSASVKAGDWPAKGWCYWLKPPLCLSGLTVGLVGFGAIGKMMGSYCHALGMKILAWSRSESAQASYPFEYVDLPVLLSESDVISLHCPLVPDTANLINAASIELMKDGVILINTARGGLMDARAVADALATGKIAGLGTDVLPAEPPHEDDPLLGAPNALLTPHMAWATLRARQRIVDVMAENIRLFFANCPQNLIAGPGLVS